MSNSKIIIAVDGHSSCGKSTISKQLAQLLKYNYIDTGAMYRAVAFFALQNNLIANQVVNVEGLIEQLSNIRITFQFNEADQKSDTYLNGENVEQEIREMTVSKNVSQVAVIKEVRYAMVHLQQEMGRSKGIVMDGRDIGTVVFPQAELKLFITAKPEIRAQRRFDELSGKGSIVDFDEILANVIERDHIDSTREESPLRQADDALVLDNSYLTREEQLKWVLEKVKAIIDANRN